MLSFVTLSIKKLIVPTNSTDHTSDKLYTSIIHGEGGTQVISFPDCKLIGSLQSVDMSSGVEWWTGMMELQTEQK